MKKSNSLFIYFVILVVLFFSPDLFAQSDDRIPPRIKTDNQRIKSDNGIPALPNNSSSIIINVPANYPTIQAAINAANNGDVITVDAGTYREDITLNKSLQIRGANYSINPNTGSRVTETIIQPATSEPDVDNAYVINLYIGSGGSGSTIDGFTFDGDNPTLTSGLVINGADIDAGEAIAAYDDLSNTSVSNNIIKNIAIAGIEFYNFSAASTYDNIITNNKFDNILALPYGVGVIVYNNCYASITNNVMTRVRLGVQTGNFNVADLGTNHSISNNSIQSSRLAIFHNLAYTNATAFTIDNNIITTMSGSTNNIGIEVSSILSSVVVNMNNNNITGASEGYDLWNCPTSSTVTVTGGVLTNCRVGVFANNYDGYSSDADPSIYAMTGVTMTNCDTAIYVKDNNLNSNSSTVALNINNATNIVNGTGIGLLIEGGDASVSFNGAVPVDFSTSLSKYIRLATNGSNIPTSNINAQNVQFGSANGTTLSNAQLFAVEDKIDHKIDWSSLGFVSVKAFNNYVTINSFYPPNTSAASIQNAIAADVSGDTTNVGTGTFNQNVIVNQSITLNGNGTSSTILTPAVAYAGVGINVTSSNANVNNLRVSTFDYGLSTAATNVRFYNVESILNFRYGINMTNGANGITMIKCKNNSNLIGGWRVGTADVINNVLIDSCEFKTNGAGPDGFGTFIAATTSGTNVCDNITIRNSDFSDNLKKGIYFEKLRNGLFDNLIINNSGYDPSYGFNNGIDINLKYDTYTDITIQNCSVTNCGAMGIATNVNNPCAITIKARDDSPNYNSDPATLTDVTVRNNFVSGPINGLRFGEFDKTNNSPTGNVVEENNFGNGYSNKAIVNKTANNITVSCNWYGTTTASAVVALHSSNLTFIPYLVNGTDNDPAAGFQPVPGSCTGLGPVINLTLNISYSAIQPAINAANPNNVIEISAGSYNERVVINKSITLQGVSETTCKVTGTGLVGTGRGIQIDNGVTNVIIKKLTVENFAGLDGNTDAGIYGIGGNNNLTIEHVTIQNNVGGSGFYANGPVNTVMIDSITSSGHTSTARGIVIWNGLKQNITIKNCHVFNNDCCGIELQDGQASGVTITDNNVHNNADNGMGLLGMQGPGENLIKMNTLLNNGRFGIEIKNPNGSGLTTGAGRIVVENNNVSRSVAIVDDRDIVGIAAFRRSVGPGNVDVPNGVVIQNNIVSGYTQPSVSEGFGIVIEGLNHTVSGNTVSGCDVGIQRQAGHTPLPPLDGDQSNVADTYFGRGNSQQTCGNILAGNILTNTINTRDVGAGTGSGIVKNNNTTELFCTIQSAIDDAQTLNGHVIDVDSGYNNESVVINKQVTILGNGGSPNSRPIVEGVTGQTFSVTVPNVTINNILVKFNQGPDTTGIRAAASGSFNNLTVKNCCIYGTGTTGGPIFNSFGIQLGTFGGVLYDQVNLDSNEIKHTGTSPIGRGVKTFNCYGDWKNSRITGFYSIQSGDIQGGILNITGDSLRGETEINYLGTGAHSFSNNICSPSNSFGPGTDFALLELKNISLVGANLNVSGNTFQTYVNFGLFSGRSNNVTLDNNTFTPDLSAVNFRSIRIDTKQRTTTPQSAFASGAIITNNTFNGNTAICQAGISVELANSDNVSSFGSLTLGTLGNENDFNNNVNKNISLNNETASTSGDPVWATTYVSTKAKVTLDVSGINNTYNVGAGFESPAAMSLANLFLLEDRIQHEIDDSGLGFVLVKSNNDYVTVNSFVTPATTTPSVQRGIDAASAGFTVNVNTGSYTEQLEINKALTLDGQGTGSTNIISPNVLLLSFTTPAVNRPVVYVHDAADVIITDLTVDGAGKGNANNRFQGIAYRNAGGTVTGCEIKAVRNTPIDGAQAGVGIYAFADDGNPRLVNFVSNNIYDFQKNATVFRGADLTVRIDSNVITGAGPVNFIAQNGIQLSEGTGGSMRNNTVNNFCYDPGNPVSCGFLIFGPSDPDTASRNSLTGCQVGIYYIDIGGVISENTINATAANTGVTTYWGIIADPGGEPRVTPQPFDPETINKKQKNILNNNRSSITTSIFRNVMTSDGTNGIGLEMAAIGTETLNATATENKINGWDAAIYFYKDAGATLNGIANDNDLGGNVYALFDQTGVLQNGTCNWFGTTDNSTIMANISGAVDYAPFLVNGTDNDAAIGFQPVPGSCTGLPASTINIKVLPQGFYNTTTEKLNMSDTVMAYLHSNVSPYNVLDSSMSVIDSITFQGTFMFTEPSGTYYIAVKHRNSIETWSKSGGEPFIAATTMNYDFTNLASKAFLNNMKQVDASPLTFGIYSGDVNQDNFVELADITFVYNAGIAFAAGYLKTDVTGDNITDLTDLIITYNNSVAFVQRKKP